MGGWVDIMLPILDMDKDCFAVSPHALMQVSWDGERKKWYAGKAKNLRGRLRGHFGFNHSGFNRLCDIINERDHGLSMKDLTSCLIIIFPINGSIERTKFEIEVIKETEPIYNLCDNPRYGLGETLKNKELRE